MSDLLGRAYRVAKAYLDEVKGRVDEVDAATDNPQAQAEYDRSVNFSDRIPDPPTYNTSTDPMQRAAAKIAALRGQSQAYQEIAPPDPLQTAYKILGVAPGSDWPTVQQATEKLRQRGAPSNFPNGSEEQSQAKIIMERVEESYQVLKNALDPTEGRFDRLEI